MGQFGKVLNLRILFDTSILATATRDHGIGAYARRLARALGGHPVAGVEMVFLGYGRSGFRLCSSAHEALRPTTRFRRYHWSYHFRLELNRWARRARADLVHLPHTAASPLYGLRCPWVVTAHDLIPFRFSRHYPDWSSGGPWGRRWLDRRRYRRARRVVAVSDATAADVGRLCDISAARIDVVGHGLDAAWAAGPTQATWLRDYVFYVGDADPRKDLATLLQGLGESGTGWSLVWAGVTSPSRAARVRAT
ncbi:MAG: glycosyltransferase, partial [Myxococcota bacterium]